MATKPVSSFVMATNANYSAGPQIGNPTKVIPADTANGVIPGQGVPAAWNNYIFNITGQWTGWLLAGSTSPTLDAHIVETNASGKIEVASAIFGGTASTQFAIRATQNTGAGSSTILVSNNGTGFGVLASSAGSSAAIRGLCTGTGAGVQGIGLGTNNVGVQGSGTGSGAGGSFTGGSTAGPGILAVGGASGDGVTATGTNAGYGVDATGGASSLAGVRGTAGNTSSPGVYGQTSAAALSTTAGVNGFGQGDAVGVKGNAVDGYGVSAQSDLTSPKRAALHIYHRDNGSVIDRPRVYREGQWMSPWSTANGNCHGLVAPRVNSVVTSANPAAWVDVTGLTIESPYAYLNMAGGLNSGNIVFWAAASFGDADTSLHHYFIDLRILNVTAGTVVFELSSDGGANGGPICTGAAMPDATVDGFVHSAWSGVIPYASFGNFDPLEFKLQFKCNQNIGGSDALCGNASFFVMGVFG
jgi:hypothetical protein